MKNVKLKIGTRGSRLALAQARAVGDSIALLKPGLAIEIVVITTRGDNTTGPLADMGGKGLFTAELEAGLLNGELDLAVHSAKDMPAADPAGLVIAATPPREDPRDVLVTGYAGLTGLPSGARVGTGSLRRSAFLYKMRDDLEILPVRGNVETRLGKVFRDTSELDAVVLAMAGLKRSGLSDEYANSIQPLDVESFIPAAGQGILAIQTAGHNDELISLLGRLDDQPTHDALRAERFVLRTLGVDCHSCVAVHVYQESSGWKGLAMQARPDGKNMKIVSAQAKTSLEVGESLVRKIIQPG